MKKIIFIKFLLISFLFCGTAFAQEEDILILEEVLPNISKDLVEVLDSVALEILEEEKRPEELKVDEDIKLEELGVEKIGILPDSAFYGIKNLIRDINIFFIFDPLKKLEKKLEYINKRVLEINKVLIEKNIEEKKLKKITEKNEKDFNYIVENIDNLKSKKSDLEVNKFLDKLTDRVIKQQRILENIEKNVGENIFIVIKENREKHIEKFGEIMIKVLEEKGEIEKRINRVMDSRKGSKFRELKNLEFLEVLNDKALEEFQEVIEKIQEKRIENFLNTYKEMNEENREKIVDYLTYMKGNSLRHLEIINKIKKASGVSEELNAKLDISKDKIIERIEKDFFKLKEEESRDAYMGHLTDGELQDVLILEEVKFYIGFREDGYFEPPSEIMKTIEKAIQKNKEKIESYPDVTGMFKVKKVENNIELDYIVIQEDNLSKIDKIKIEIMNSKRNLSPYFMEELNRKNLLEEFEEHRGWFNKE